MTNVFGTLPDSEEVRVVDLLSEQLLVLHRIERSLETLMTHASRQSTALEVIETLVDEIAARERDE